MKKNDMFTFIAPNGVKVTAIVLDKQLKRDDCILVIHWYLCYAQNRLFYFVKRYFPDVDKTEYEVGNTIVNHVIIPDYDSMLENYQHQLDMANDYTDKTL